MATDFTQDSVLHYLQSSGGSVKNSDLLLHFRGFLRDHADQVRNRDLFKKFVNSVATVKQEDGVSHVVLRKKFRGFVPGSGGTGAPAWSSDKPRGKTPKREARATSPAASDAILPAAGIVLDNNNSGDFNLSKSGSGSSPGPGPRQAPKPQQVIPGVAAAPAREQRAVKAARQTVGFAPPPELHPAAPAHSLQPGPARGEAGPPQGVGLTPGPQAGGGVPPDDLQHQVRLVRHRKSYKTAVSYDDDEEQEEEEKVPMVVGSTAGARPPSEPLGRLDRAASSPCLLDQIAPPPVSSSSTDSPSSERKPPKIYIQDVEGQTPQPHARRWPPEQGAGLGGHWAGRAPALEPAAERRSVPGQRHTPSPRRGEEEEEGAGLQAYEQDRRSSQPAAVQGKGWSQSERARLSSSHSSVFSPSSDAGFSSSEWPSSGSPRGSGWNSSYEDFQGGAAEVGGAKGQDVLQRAQESVLHRGVVKTSIPWHRSAEQLHVDQEFEARAQTLYRSTDRLNDNQLPTPKVLPWHLSTGDLYDDVESSDGSTSSPPLHPSVARRVSSRLRSRMYRSLGANLDQLLQEEEAAAAAAAEGGGGAGGGAVGNEAARLNRLHMISSSLSLRHHLSSSSLSSCSTPPRCHSMADLTEDPERKGRKRRSQPGSAPSAGPAPRQDTPSSQQSPVPLEPREHAWLVKGAAGAWPDIYSLFREDPSLLNRRDFISGFTVLHWIAKHGDHRVLNTLWYGVEKAGLTLDVDARSACGHTPLHLAAMHNNKNMIRLLVSKFNADVKRRDTAGKRPWHYLSKAMPPDVFQMLGAPPRAALEGGAARGEADAGDPAYEPRQHHHHQRQHRRRHHLSFASSGERPVTVAGKVKRSTSIAAFLKRKSLAQFQGLHSDSSV